MQDWIALLLWPDPGKVGRQVIDFDAHSTVSIILIYLITNQSLVRSSRHFPMSVWGGFEEKDVE